MITIATRGSLLALWQAEHVQRGLTPRQSRIEIVRTTGDRIIDVPLSQIGGRGLFTRELDEAVLAGDADCGVHSLKDVPTEPADGLVIAAILEREDPRDAWLSRDGSLLHQLKPGARVGTSALRRRALVLEQRQDLNVLDVRGNLDTRLRKLDDGDYDALVLAAAGLNRLDRSAAITAMLDAPSWLPAPGQGAIAVVARADDTRTIDALRGLDHQPTRVAVTAERALLRALEGGCQVPIGALAHLTGTELQLHALVADPDGTTILRDAVTVQLSATSASTWRKPADEQADRDAATRAGRALADRLNASGAHAILDRIRSVATAHEVTPP